MFLKTADRDRPLAREVLKQIPLKFWGRKTLRGLVRLYLTPLRS
jgi:alpha-1,3-rhamnosyltransferase